MICFDRNDVRLATLAGLVSAAFLATFVVLGLTAQAGAAAGFDDAILRQVYLTIAPNATAVMEWLTDLGTVLVCGTATAVLAFAWWRVGAWPNAVVMALAFGSTLVVVYVAKLLFALPRPDLWPPLTLAEGFGYPSGHTALATVTYGLGALLALTVQRPLPYRLLVVAIGCTLALLVGVSRIYLGVHYPTDVVGGLLLGCALIAAWFGVFVLIRAGQRGGQEGGGVSGRPPASR